MKKSLLLLALIFGINHTAFNQVIIQSNNKFCFDFYKKIKSNENFIFSPASITSAMAMTYAGAKGNTSEEISNTFYFNKNLDEFHKDFYSLSQFSINKSSDLIFHNANSLWIDKSLKINDDFLKTNKKYYAGTSYSEDFIYNPDLARKTINNWVSKKTNNKITNLLKPTHITNSTRLVLVNAMYFKGSWNKKFQEKNNTEENFQIAKREYEKKTFMNTSINSWYYEDKYAQIIDIPYTDRNYSLMIILPKKYRNLRKIEKRLSYDYYENYITNKVRKKIILSLPKFDLESYFDLNKTLQSMGINDAFKSSADFSGITETEQLYISNVLHKAKIIVQEDGTAVVMRKTSALIESVNFKANRSFIYILRNNKNNCIYFMGKVVNPQ